MPWESKSQQRDEQQQQQHPVQVSMLLKWGQLWPDFAKNKSMCTEEDLTEEKQKKAPHGRREEGGLEGGESMSSRIYMSCGRTGEGEGEGQAGF